MKKIKEIINYVRRDLFIFMSGPIEYIFTKDNSKTKTVSINRFDPKVKQLGNTLQRDLKKNLNIDTVHFVGSAALEIAGQRDVDILVEVPRSEFKRYIPMINTLYGKPAKVVRDELVEWHFNKGDCAVQVVLIDTKSSLLKMQKVTFRELSKEHNRLAYQKLKESSDGVTIYEYEKRRLEFFNKMLKKRFGILFIR